MFEKSVKLFLIGATAFIVGFSEQPVRAVKEVADPMLPDIAMVHFSPGEDPVILYNPMLCRQAGPALCEFYRYHEYGHIVLRHNERDHLTVQEQESEADEWAAKHAPLTSVMAAYRFFSAGGGASPMHGKSENRAARMITRQSIAPEQSPIDL